MTIYSVIRSIISLGFPVILRIAPEDLDARAEGNLLVDWVMTNSGLKEFKRFDKPLLKELAVQISEWWRENPSEELPTRERMAYEFGARFGSVVAYLAGNSIITRAKWRAYVAPFMRQGKAQAK